MYLESKSMSGTLWDCIAPFESFWGTCLYCSYPYSLLYDTLSLLLSLEVFFYGLNNRERIFHIKVESDTGDLVKANFHIVVYWDSSSPQTKYRVLSHQFSCVRYDEPQNSRGYES